MIITVLISVILFGTIIFIHELGHFLMARRFNVSVDEFSIGMGPKIFSKEKNGTTYSLRALPIGGYVSMAGEDEYSSDPNALHNKKKWQRFLIFASGALMNIILGFIVMLIYVSFSGNIYTNKIESFLVANDTGAYVTQYNGLQKDDEIIKINGEFINVRYDYVFAAIRSVNKPCDITVLRDGKRTVVNDFVFPTFTENGETYGNPSFFIPYTKSNNMLTVLHESVFQTISVVKTVVFSLYDIVTGNFSPEAVSGPIGVVSEIHETVKVGILPLMFLFCMITINIGVFNLLPFPALDGGRILLLFIEWIIGRPINKKIETFVNLAGLIILFTAMILITFKDIIILFN